MLGERKTMGSREREDTYKLKTMKPPTPPKLVKHFFKGQGQQKEYIGKLDQSERSNRKKRGEGLISKQ